MKVLINPEEVGTYLSGLNESFGHWGDQQAWDWTFARGCGEGPASRLVVTGDDGAWIAGSAVSWRTLTGGGRVGIMTGSWTLPAARGCGCFSTFIRHSSALVQRSSGRALLSFVTAANASRRRLEASGADLVESLYVRSAVGTQGASPVRLLPEEFTPALTTELWHLHARQSAGGHGFEYPDADSFAGQFLLRPNPTAIFRDADSGSLAIFEQAHDTDRLLFAGGPDEPRERPEFWSGLAAWANERGRNFFGFAIHPAQCAALRATSLELIPGFLCVNGASAQTDLDPGPGPRDLRSEWVLQSGDRM